LNLEVNFVVKTSGFWTRGNEFDYNLAGTGDLKVWKLIFSFNQEEYD